MAVSGARPYPEQSGAKVQQASLLLLQLLFEDLWPGDNVGIVIDIATLEFPLVALLL